jgi:hypothetical protein
MYQVSQLRVEQRLFLQYIDYHIINYNWNMLATTYTPGRARRVIS